jgi:hypothetical protein
VFGSILDQRRQQRVGVITTPDGTEIFYKEWARDSRPFSAMGGLCPGAMVRYDSADSGPLSARLVPTGTTENYEGFPHGMPTTEVETISSDLLGFFRS